MWVFYAVAFLMLILGGIFWYVRFTKYNTKFCMDLIFGGVIGLLIASTSHAIAYTSATSDVQVMSASIQKVVYYPQWVEKTTTHRVGKRTKYRTHFEEWEAYVPVFQRTISITREQYLKFHKELGGQLISEQPYKGGFYSGDKNIYITNNASGVVIPYMANFDFENKVKATPSLWKFEPPEDTSHIHEYPYITDNFESNRLLGTSIIHLSHRKVDEMNSRLGPTMKVNVIFIGFDEGDPIQHSYDQEAYWIGGKKNDLVITYSGNNRSGIKWVRVFGWTEEEAVKANISTIILQHGISDEVLPKIEQEILHNYKIKDWKKFDYLTVEPTTTMIVVSIIVQLFAQVAIYVAFHNVENKY